MTTAGIREAAVQRNKPRGRRVSVVDAMAGKSWGLGTVLVAPSTWSSPMEIVETAPGELRLSPCVDKRGSNWVRSLPWDVQEVDGG